jgi:hypothetical protein
MWLIVCQAEFLRYKKLTKETDYSKYQLRPAGCQPAGNPGIYLIDPGLALFAVILSQSRAVNRP